MSETPQYEGHYIRLTEEEINGDVYERAYIRGAVIIFVQDSDGQFIFIKEKRPHEETKIRIKPVTGFLEDELSWQENAQKELQEEIGFKASSLQLIAHIRNTGSVNVSKYFVLARGLTPSKLDTGDDEDQILGTIKMELSHYIEKSVSGEIVCNFDSLGAFLLQNALQNKRLI